MKLIDKIGVGRRIVESSFLKKRNLISVEFQITSHCNLSCKYCVPISKYIDKNGSSAGKILTFEQISETFSKLSRLNVERVNLSGGEPLLRNDIDKILKSAFGNKFKLTVTTNGIFVPRYIDILTRVNSLIISCDGQEHTHDFLRGKGTFKEVIKALDICKQRNIKVLISAVITGQTSKQDLLFLIKLCDFYDIFCVFQPVANLLFFRDTHKADEKIGEFVPTQRHLKGLIVSLKNNRHKSRIIGGNMLFKFLSQQQLEPFRQPERKEDCMAGRLFLYIAPDGRMFPCTWRCDPLSDKTIQECTPAEINNIKVDKIKCPGCSCYAYKILNNLARLDLRSIVYSFRCNYV